MPPFLQTEKIIRTIVRLAELNDYDILVPEEKQAEIAASQQEQQDAAIGAQASTEQGQAAVAQAEAAKHEAQAGKYDAEALANQEQAGLFGAQAGAVGNPAGGGMPPGTENIQ